ncbi:peptidase S49, protease IV:Peptidase S49, SppA [[Actinomadura] parvosata subsp. kistnae]|uniref:Signal peptide peptidase SppA n=1 Tax=[Actinomadura] parvosata subsp. kistnae TaxID=1909395 RepID=A0A1V0AFM3_9ACTN|nr:signal peptide peptidase SppA [Nonomuraea sp. ATCC 55076]AQZ69034.1 signal peptide peptidase SppA [Nonomuraea sp. ATCC 55076]SPL92396.1 peptidase S49, protease IV:Peptidase S49, SppA [Actinomadura parvosata subsp. kistnae]
MDAGKAIIETVEKLRQRRTAPLILELDLTEGLTEGPPADPLAAVLSMRKPRLADVLSGLKRARQDPRVKALVVKIGGQPLGLAMVQELRQAVIHFRASGKLTVAFSESFGEFGGGTVPYYLATAFERLYLQPSGDVGLTGVALEQRFVKGALEKLGVGFEAGQRHEYKTAPNTFTQDHMTDPHRESMARIVESVTETLVAGIADGRRLDPGKVRELVDRGPFTASEAQEAGLVDGLAYRDEVYDELKRAAGDDAHLLYVSRYARGAAVRKLPHPMADAVALVHATGMIRTGRSGRSPLGGGGAMGSDTISAALRAARRDDHIKAVVFRVDSPGGSYVASDTVWREVTLTRKVKPVIVSMGDLAASGGYFISMAADVIVAQPGTLTGSIGVYGGKPVFAELLEKVGVNSEMVAEGANAGMFSTSRGFSPEQWERINAWLDRIYDDFVGKVAQSRDLSRERAHELARGRVWTGADARSSGLVDELGGLEDALAMARKRAGLAEDAPVRTYPRLNPLERLRGPESSEDRSAALARIRMDAWGPLARLSAELGLPAVGPLILPGWYTIR